MVSTGPVVSIAKSVSVAGPSIAVSVTDCTRNTYAPSDRPVYVLRDASSGISTKPKVELS